MGSGRRPATARVVAPGQKPGKLLAQFVDIGRRLNQGQQLATSGRTSMRSDAEVFVDNPVDLVQVDEQSVPLNTAPCPSETEVLTRLHSAEVSSQHGVRGKPLWVASVCDSAEEVSSGQCGAAEDEHRVALVPRKPYRPVTDHPRSHSHDTAMFGDIRSRGEAGSTGEAHRFAGPVGVDDDRRSGLVERHYVPP